MAIQKIIGYCAKKTLTNVNIHELNNVINDNSQILLKIVDLKITPPNEI